MDLESDAPAIEPPRHPVTLTAGRLLPVAMAWRFTVRKGTRKVQGKRNTKLAKRKNQRKV